MLKKNQYINIRWNGQTKKYWEEKGYKYTKINDIFSVDVNDLPPKSSVFVDVVCDYCGEIMKMHMYSYTNCSKNGKIACVKCRGKKIKETNLIKYGVENVMQIEENKIKLKNTLLNRYNIEFPLQNKEFLEKAKNNKNIEESTQKFKKAFLEKYGVDNPGKIPEIVEKAKETCRKKYGGNSSQCDKNIRQKSFNTMLSNGNVPSSKPERKMVEIIKKIYGENNCFPQYIFDKIIFDCLLKINDCKIDIEYDCNYWHNRERDKRRDYFTIKNGFKVLRFRTDNSIPTEEQIKESINCLINTNKKVLIIDI